MINAKDFVEAAREFGFNRYTGVPCSFLTPFINYVINDDSLEYVSSANEGDALATAAGSAIGGQPAVVMMQNSGLGNAVSPITSLSYVFRIPFLIITTHRGQPGVKDEPQHELMGQITKELFDTMKVPWEIFPKSIEEIEPALKRASEYMKKEQRPYAFIMQKGTVAAEELKKNPVKNISARHKEYRSLHNHDAEITNRDTALKRIIDHTPKNKAVLIATTGFTGRELFAIDDRENQLYMVGSMGCASSLGLGIALARPDLKIVIIDGDGAGLMRMGNFATIGSYAGNNLIHILLDNEVHDSTGSQATVAGNIDFAKIAEASGYSVSLTGNKIDLIDDIFKLEGHDGPVFGHLKISSGTMDNLPRPDVTPNEVLTRLMQHIETTF
ncbi:MAG: phosphonopyruvate decarboxylase [Proteobacteria bacterium]|nr:phosphonopyruvate decarboxylase [Pseudomonadota bacterium]NOG61364.1 phosphonopyruvate decarboxylase [Pseudomonadota bacterium]